MGEQEEFYRRQNAIAAAMFLCDIANMCRAWNNKLDDIHSKILKKWREDHGEPPVELQRYWNVQRLVSIGQSMTAMEYGHSLNMEVISFPMYWTPEKGTAARTAWDAAKKRAAAKRRKAKERTANDD